MGHEAYFPGAERWSGGCRLSAGCIITIIQLRRLSREAIGARARDPVITFPPCCYLTLSLDGSTVPSSPFAETVQ